MKRARLKAVLVSERRTEELPGARDETPTLPPHKRATLLQTSSTAVEKTAEETILRLSVDGRKIEQPVQDWRVVNESRYNVEGEHAVGGTGRILRAHDSDLDRPVALKELLVSNKDEEARFIREALVTARLQHPAIVPVYEAGRWQNGKPFYAMKMISGRSLHDIMAEKRSLNKRLALLPHIIAVADAMAYSHGQGVIHRDLKPSNVLIGPFGETVVVDWGLAADLSGGHSAGEGSGPYQRAASGLTIVGTVLGTPQYMPPEQAQGKPVDARADVYAIGAILYQLLGGQPPHDGKTSKEVLAKVAKEEPVPIQKRQPAVPQDLATIITKAMSRDAGARYPTAKELAEDLKRFQTGQLVTAHKYTKLMLLRRWLARHRPLMILAAVFVVLALAGGALAIRRVIHERNAVRASRNELLLVQARTSLERDPTEALAWLKTYVRANADLDPAREIAIEAESLGVAKHVFRRTFKRVSGVAFSSDGRLLGSAGPDATARIYQVDTGGVVAELPYSGEIRAMQFSPVAPLLMWSDWNATTLVIWNYQTGETRKLTGHTGVIYRTFFSPDGRSIASAGDDQTVRLWDTESGTSRILYKHDGAVTSLNFTADGQYIVSAGKDDVITVWDLASNLRLFSKKVGPNPYVFASHTGDDFAYATADGTIVVLSAHSPERFSQFRLEPAGWVLSFSKDNRLIVAGGSNGMIRLLDLRTKSGSLFLGHNGPVLTAILASDDKVVVSAGQDGTVRIWDVATPQTRVLRGQRGGVLAYALSPDERYLSSIGCDGTVRVWEMAELQRFTDVRLGHTGKIQTVTFSANSRFVASGGIDGTVRLWDLTQQASPRIYPHGNAVIAVRFSADSTLLASAGTGSSVFVWNINDGTKIGLPSNDKLVWDVQFSHAGHLLVTATADGSVRLWDALTGQVRWLGKHQSDVTAVAFSSDDRFVVSASKDGEMKLWNVSDGASTTVAHESVAKSFALSADDRLLASASPDGRIYVRNLIDQTERVLVGHGAGVRALKFTPNVRYLVSGGIDSTVRLWDLQTGVARKLSGVHGEVHQIDISQNGELVAAALWDSTIHIWDLVTGQLQRIVRHSDLAQAVTFSPDGRLLASAGNDKVVRLIEPQSPDSRQPSDLKADLDNLTSASLSPGGELSTPYFCTSHKQGRQPDRGVKYGIIKKQTTSSK